MLAAQFYLPPSVPDERKSKMVIDIISELGLIKAKDTPIGNERVRGVSGGERKRCNIAVQLISNPSVLFLDEPTSGLDSFQAQAVMEAMKTMAQSGRLVVSVIHQPRSSIFDMFDKLLLLSRGRTMYMGDASSAADWFASRGLPCPKLFNPSDFFLDILSPDNRSPELEQQSTAQIDMLGVAWSQQGAPSLTIKDAASAPSELHKEDSIVEVFSFEAYMARLIKNFKLLAWRSFSEQIRDSVTIFAKLFLVVFFSSLTGAMYNNAGYNQEAILNRTGLLFIVCSKYSL
jgi:ABC-type multidrug transport system ATPase subunit